MRVVFLGNAPWSVPSLEALADSPHRPVLVVTRDPRPAGRGSRLRPTSVAEEARRLGLPPLEVPTVKTGEGFDALVDAAPEVLAVVAYGEIVPKAVLEIPSLAPINVHFSLLPELRGAAPVQRAILDGLVATGVTTMRMDEGMDTGPILLQAEEAIDGTDDAGSLGERLAAIGGRLLVDTLDRLEAGTLEETPQNDAAATFAPRLTAEDEWIDWSAGADRIVRQVRALAPQPGARTTFRGKTLKVLAASKRALHTPAHLPPDPFEPPGTMFAAGFSGASPMPVVAVGGPWVIVLDQVQPEGKRRMSGEEFHRGYRPNREPLGGPRA
jgi:methionyl-tRNA formyltransferase